MSSPSDTAASAAPARKRLVLLALDGADWPALQQAAEHGFAPYLSSMIDAGSWAPLAFPLPQCRASGWLSVATGLHADRHGILHAQERLAGSVFVQAPTAASLRAPALWDWTAAAGLSTAVIGWPATRGLALGTGCCIAPGTESAIGRSGQAWPMHPDAVSPASLRAGIAGLRVHPDYLQGADLAFLLAPLAPASRARVAPGLARLFAECTSLHAFGTYALEHLDSDVLMLRLPLLGDVEPLLQQVAQDPGAGACRLLCYQFVDLLCGRYMNLAGRDAHFAILSNGSGHGAAAGFAILSGPGVLADAALASAMAVDLLPTLARLLGLGIDIALDGEAIAECLLRPAAAQPATKPGPMPMLAADIEPVPAAVVLEYPVLESEHIAVPDFSAALARASGIEAETRFALAQTTVLRGRRAAAIAMLRSLCQRWPAFAAARVLLAEQLLAAKQFDECREVLQYFPQVQEAGMWQDLAEGLLAFGRQDWPLAQACLTRLAATGTAPLNVHAWLGRVHAQQGNADLAAEAFGAALAREPWNIQAWEGLGEALGSQQRLVEAAHAFGKAVSLAPRSAALLNRLARAWDAAGEPARAAAARARAMKLDPAALARVISRQA
jgi:tetratricopeptide (TPR) repeat protein